MTTEVDGSNHLIPIGAEIDSGVSVRFETVDVGDVLDVIRLNREDQ